MEKLFLAMITEFSKESKFVFNASISGFKYWRLDKVILIGWVHDEIDFRQGFGDR